MTIREKNRSGNSPASIRIESQASLANGEPEYLKACGFTEEHARVHRFRTATAEEAARHLGLSPQQVGGYGLLIEYLNAHGYYRLCRRVGWLR